jgi:prolyl-tRNA synthetase
MVKSELADYSSVSGCMILLQRRIKIWEKVKEECDKEFKKIGVQNCYFPLFIPEKSFEKESEHVKGFTPEVAWVTQAGNTKLNEKLAVVRRAKRLCTNLIQNGLEAGEICRCC